MCFCKKISICILICTLCSFCTGCSHDDQKAFFKRDSAYDQMVQDSSESSRPRRVGNVIYLGSTSNSSPKTKVSGEPSFEFEDLKR